MGSSSSRRTASCASGWNGSSGSSESVTRHVPRSESVADELARWASERAPELLARAEEEAVAVLRETLLRAALGERGRKRVQSATQEQPPAIEPQEQPPAIEPQEQPPAI